jgi:hypothetical protein
MPRFVLTRLRKDDRSRYFGPFAYSSLVRKTLTEMRRQFGVLLGDAHPVKIAGDVYRLYDDVRAELYGHANEVSAADYRRRVDAACEFLEGKSREWLGTLRAEMQAARPGRSSSAPASCATSCSRWRRRWPRRAALSAPRRCRAPTRSRCACWPEALRLPAPPAHLECFDISHISGTFVVASMVHFTAGRPDKAQYRRFQIKSFVGNDDFRAMTEVVGRRYRRLAEEKKPFPDLVVIDGGQGQVGAALKAFRRARADAAAAHRPGEGTRDDHLSPTIGRRSTCRSTTPACSSSSACATKPTASPTPITPTSARRRSASRSSTISRPRPGAPAALLEHFGSIDESSAPPPPRRSRRSPASGRSSRASCTSFCAGGAFPTSGGDRTGSDTR